jgi:hypothetical protein
MSKDHLGIRAPVEIIERIDRLAAAFTERAVGAHIKRSEATRLVIERGLASFEKELGLVPPRAKKRTPRA